MSRCLLLAPSAAIVSKTMMTTTMNSFRRESKEELSYPYLLSRLIHHAFALDVSTTRLFFCTKQLGRYLGSSNILACFHSMLARVR